MNDRGSNAAARRLIKAPHRLWARPLGLPVLVVVATLAMLLGTAGGQGPAKPLVRAINADYTFGQGYIEAGANGGAYAFGNGTFEGSTFSANHESAQQWWGNPIVGIAALPGNNGYFFASNDTAADDSITCAFGAALAYEFYPNQGYYGNWCYLTWSGVDDIAAIAVDNANGGYWELGADGALYAFGGAPYLGSANQSGLPSGQHIVGMAATHDGGGYWEVTNGGYIYAYGDAAYEGGMGGTNLACAIVGITAAQNDSSYWMDGCDGGVFSFGQAVSYGSLAQTAKYFNIQAITSTPDGNGFYLMAWDGSIFTYGDAQFQGAIYGTANGQIVGVAGTT